MANAKISELSAASTPVAGSEVLPIVQGGNTVKVSIDNLTAGKATATGNLSVTGTGAVSGNFAVNTDKFAVLAASGNTTVAGTLDVTGNVAVNTNKFNITAASGNTTTAGTLGVTGDFAINTNKFNVTASSGNTTTAGTLGVTGDLAVNTNKFNVTASSGNTAVAGTLSAVGDFAINTNKFQVTASSGNTTVAGTLGVTGMTTVTGGLTGGVQSLSGAGAVNLTTLVTSVTSSGVDDALTLANGTAGQIKIVSHTVDGGSAILTPATALGYTSITFTNAGETATLLYTSAGWAILSVRGATVNS